MVEQIWQQVMATTAIEWVGTGTGLAAVALSVRQHRAAWPLFIVCYAAYAWLSFRADLLAAAAMNAVFVLLSIDGWRRWAASDAATSDAATSDAATSDAATSDPDGPASELAISRGGPRSWAALLGVWLVSAAALTAVLHAAASAQPPLDAAATTSGLVAQWLLTRKRLETWAFWVVSDVAFMALYASAGYWLTVGLFALFLGLAAHGAWTWRRQIAEAE